MHKVDMQKKFDDLMLETYTGKELGFLSQLVLHTLDPHANFHVKVK